MGRSALKWAFKTRYGSYRTLGGTAYYRKPWSDRLLPNVNPKRVAAAFEKGVNRALAGSSATIAAAALKSHMANKRKRPPYKGTRRRRVRKLPLVGKASRKFPNSRMSKHPRPTIDPGHTGVVTKTSYSKKNKMNVKMSKSKTVLKSLTQPFRYYIDNKSEIKGGYNVQALGTLLYLFPTSELRLIQEAQYPTGDGVHPQPSAQSRILLESVTGTLTLTNLVNGVTFLTLYTLRSKAPQAMGDSTSDLSPESLWDTGTEQMTAAAGTDTTRIGWKPSYSSRFNDYWKIVQTNKIVLHSAAIHQHSFNIKCNKIMDWNKLLFGVDGSLTQFPGLSYAFLAVASGQPGVDTANNALIGTMITDIVTTSEYVYKYRTYLVDQKQAKFKPTALDGITDMEKIDEDSGLAAVIQCAGTQAV